MTATRDGLMRDGNAWLWGFGQTRLVGATFVPAGRLSGWWAHFLTPHQPIAWVCDPVDGVDVFRAVFGDAWSDRVDRILTSDGAASSEELSPPRVSDAFARVVVVRSVARWSPEPLDDVQLLIDEALAWRAAGDERRAAAAIDVASFELTELADCTWAPLWSDSTNVVPEFLHKNIAAAVRLAIDLLPDHEERDVLQELLSRVENWPVPDPEQSLIDGLAADISQWLQRHQAAARLVGATLGGETRKLESLPINPATVTPRLVHWGGPLNSDVQVQVSDDQISVSIQLAQGANAYDFEARDLAAFVCDAETGEILATHFMVASEAHNHMRAAVPLPSHEGALAVGVANLEKFDQLQLDRLGKKLTILDRLSVGRWLALRKQVLAMALLGTDHDRLQELWAEASKELETYRERGATIVGTSAHGDVEARAKFALDPTPSIDGTVFAATIAEGMRLMPPLEVLDQ